MNERHDEHPAGDPGTSLVDEDLRERIAVLIEAQSDPLIREAVAIFPLSGSDQLEPAYCDRLARSLLRLLTAAVRDGSVDPWSGGVHDVRRQMGERDLSMTRLFAFAYLLERTVLDELASTDAVGVASEPWPLAAQLVRRGSFDLLGACAERARLEPTDVAVVDELTKLHTRPFFDAVLSKELERAGRYGFGVSVILFDVDHLTAVNREQGFGVGDQILERLGILIRGYFRHHDWVARYADDAFAVLLTRTDARHADDLAERVRSTVEQRLGFADHRSGVRMALTVTAAVVHASVSAGHVIDPERLLADAEAAIGRAKSGGRNRVERFVHPVSRTLPRSSPSA